MQTLIYHFLHLILRRIPFSGRNISSAIKTGSWCFFGKDSSKCRMVFDKIAKKIIKLEVFNLNNN